ncbi:MAG: MFS transporter, partial [Erysipelotrichaceae bacterium]|nr:MFS transporter [Erysipelotrichaceae bacterium]
MKGLFKKLNESKIFKDLSPQEFSWVLYDVGNSAFTMLGCSLIPIWFKALAIGDAPGKISGDNATAYWALATSVVTVIVALIGPVCGAIADHKDTKKIFFSTSVAIGVIGCVINGFANSWSLFLIIYILTKIAYQASLTFYDSMLNDVTTDDRSDAVSAYGYAWGYIGSCIPFTVALIAYVMGPDMLQIIPGAISRFIGFGVTAAWWWIVTVPLLNNYKQINYVEDDRGAVSKAFSQIFRTLKRIAVQDKKVLYFLIAFFLYIDGVGTIIDNCINLGTDLGL